MKKIVIVLVIALSLSTVLSSCIRKSELTEDDTLPEETKKEAVDNETEETKAPETEKTPEETNNVVDGNTDTTAPSDGTTTNAPIEEPIYPDDTDSVETEPEETDPVEFEEPSHTEPVRVESITLDKYEVNIEIGETDMPWVTMLPEEAENKKEKWESSNTAVATVNYYGKITGVSEGTCTVTVTSEGNPSVSATVNVTVKAPKEPVSEVTYINGILIANKTYALPSTYNPGVDTEAGAALAEMINAAAAEGINLYQISGFRSYSTQATIYNNYVARDGQAEADRYSARPGHSEHQTGLAFDLNSLEQSFGETKEGKWLAENCWKYGFIIRYPHDKEAITGYMYEPWHVRYLGKDVAKSVYESGLCLEEYLNITSVYAD